jgi:hypothetical protein
MTQLDWLDQASARQRQAEQRLQLMVDERRQSYETRRYREHREAALKGRAV